MQPTHKVFTGYFSKNHTKKKVALHVLRLTPHAKTISVHATACGVSGQVYYCCVGFSKQHQADKAVKVLQKKFYNGIQLLARTWIGRTAANERREPNWRNHDWDGTERRRSERRRYHHNKKRLQQGGKGPAITDSSDKRFLSPQPKDCRSYLTSEVVTAREHNGQSSLPESELNDSSVLISGKF